MDKQARVWMYQKPAEYRAAIQQIGCEEAARQLYRELQGMIKHGTVTEGEQLFDMIRVDLLSRGIY